MEASGSLTASSAIADVNSSASMSAVLRMASSAMFDVNSFSSMSAAALMASSAFDALMPSKAIADVNSLLRCLQLMDVNSSLL